MLLTLYAGNTMLLRAEGLADEPTGTAIADAAVTATLSPRGGGAALWTGPLAPTATAGDYEAPIAADLPVAVGDRLDGTLVALKDAARLEVALRVQVRRR